jgi:hypothetical protein
MAKVVTINESSRERIELQKITIKSGVVDARTTATKPFIDTRFPRYSNVFTWKGA